MNARNEYAEQSISGRASLNGGSTRSPTRRPYAALDYLVEKRWLRVVERQAPGAPSYTVDDWVRTLYGDRAASLQGRWAK